MKKNTSNNWLKFSQIGFQMALTIVIFTYLGIFIDNYFAQFTPFGLVIFSLLGVFISLYNVIKKVQSFNE